MDKSKVLSLAKIKGLSFSQTSPFFPVCSTSLLKTLCVKDILLVTNNFSFSYRVFYPFQELSALHMRFHMDKSKVLSLAKIKGLSFSQTSPFFPVCSTSLLKTLCVKDILLVTNNFSFSYRVFYPFQELSALHIKFEIVCNLFEFPRL